MKIINAIGDQSLMQLKQGEWYIHTVFEHTFNLTDRKRLPLILITSFDDKRLPGGLYLPQKVSTNSLIKSRILRRLP